MDIPTYLSNLQIRCNGKPIDILSLPVTSPTMSYDAWYRKTVGTGFTVFYPTASYLIELDININTCTNNPPNTTNCIRFSEYTTGVPLTTIPDNIANSSLSSIPVSQDYTIFIVGGLVVLVVALAFDKLFPVNK